MKVRLPILLVVVGVIGLLLLQWQQLKALGKELLPIRYVRVEGVFQYLGKEDVKQVVMPWVKTDFFSSDLLAIQRAAKSLPWVHDAEVQRIWPDAIKISVYEQEPRVRWEDGSLLNTQGEIFTPDNIKQFRALPLLTGPAGHEEKLLATMLELIAALQGQYLQLAIFEVDQRRSWRIVLENGMELQLGRKDPQKKLQRFLRALPLLGPEKIVAIAKVDLRYSYGFAVVWKSGEVIKWQDDNRKKHT